jgi:hypothetical protein
MRNKEGNKKKQYTQFCGRIHGCTRSQVFIGFPVAFPAQMYLNVVAGSQLHIRTYSRQH